jgi:Fe-S-cluster containining protein
MRVYFKQAIPQEFCLKCRGCCRFSQQDSVWKPHLLEEEKSWVAKIRIIPAAGENDYICGNLSCPENKCRIYADRPFECRLYPFLFDRKDNKVFLALDLNCAFVRENNKNPEFEEYTRSLIKLIQSKEYLDILKNNPLLAQEYAGVMDLIELKV